MITVILLFDNLLCSVLYLFFLLDVTPAKQVTPNKRPRGRPKKSDTLQLSKDIAAGSRQAQDLKNLKAKAEDNKIQLQLKAEAQMQDWLNSDKV